MSLKVGIQGVEALDYAYIHSRSGSVLKCQRLPCGMLSQQYSSPSSQKPYISNVIPYKYHLMELGVLVAKEFG